MWFITEYKVLSPSYVPFTPCTGTLSFFVSIGYFGLNETALELEVPFGLGANHLPVVRQYACVLCLVASACVLCL